MTIDLHIHSTFSDGTKSPIEIIELASKNGLSAISLTDHDTMRGTRDMVRGGEKVGIEVVPGLELSVVHDGSPIHILGYFVDENNEQLQAGLKKIQQARDERNRKIIEKLNKLGIPVTVAHLKDLSGGGQAGRPHIGKMLIQAGVVKTLNQAFKFYLKKGRCGYVARQEFKAAKAIELIKQAGGVAIFSHPIQFDASLRSFPVFLKQLLAIGLDGVELYYPTQSPSFRKKLRKMSDPYDIIYTGGSDYHGDIRPKTSLGVRLSDEKGKIIMSRMKKRVYLED